MWFVSQSYEFLFFLALVLPVYYLLGWVLQPQQGRRLQNLLLLTGSYVFYGWWDVRFLLLIVISTVVDFCCGLMIDCGKLTLRARLHASICLPLAAMLFVAIRWQSIGPDRADIADWASWLRPDEFGMWVVGSVCAAVCAANLLYPIVARLNRQTQRRLFLGVSVAANLGILGFFKYFNFFAESLVEFAGQFNVHIDQPTLDILLPAGISFYTFQTMGYTIDIYRGRIQPTARFADFMLYVSFFPQLVMGPIERAAQLLPQISSPRPFCGRKIISGLQLGVWGYFKKAVIADNLADIVNQIFTNPSPSGAEVMLGVYAFAFQIYCDFSGYTDIARGVARMLGIELRMNFRLPYFATNPSDFWQRWHISLSTWLRDYLYFPLGGNRVGRLRTFRNLLVTMLLGGLWHGAAWTYVAWGAYHGLLLVLFRMLWPARAERSANDKRQSGFRFWFAVLLYFQLTCVGWLIFRAESSTQIRTMALAVFTNFDLAGLSFSAVFHFALLTAPLVGFQVYQHHADEQDVWRRWSVWAQAAFILALYYGIVFFEAPRTYAFYYFQF
jgi:D-alanyl-lipoteichoic acid acyltransferase DltB (MBOAT superfamily)